MPSRKITPSLATHHTRKIGKSNSWHEDHGEKRTAKIAAKRQRAIDQYGGNAGGMVSVSPQKVMQATLFATAAFLALTPNVQAVNVRQARRDGSQVATPEGKWHGNYQPMVLHRKDSQGAIQRAGRSVNASVSTPLLPAPRSTTNFYAAPVTVFPGRSTTLAHANTIATMPAITSTMSPAAVHATTATALTASPMPLARALARDIFIAYTQLLVPTMNRQASLGEVFKSYLQYDQRYRRHHQETTATAADHPFMRDWG